MKREKRSKRFSFLVLFFMVGFFFNLPACGEKDQPTEQKKTKSTVQEIKKKASKPADKDKKEVSEEVVAYHYNPMGKKDPFKPLIKVEKKIAERMMIEGPLTPLQKYNLTELKLVAIVVGLGHPRAMVEDSKGDGYILSKGTFIGDSYGVVTEIKENEVVIVEKEVDPSSDEIVQREVSLILYKPEEE